LLKEVNDQFGAEIGYCDTLQDAKSKLTTKGQAYCKALQQEAIAQAYLNKYVEAYINLLNVEDKIKAGDYKSIWRTKAGDKKKEDEARAAAEADVNQYLTAYNNAMAEASKLRADFDLGGHTDPSSSPTKTTTPKDTFDAKAAARQRKEAINQWKEAVEQYIKEANAEVTKANIDSMSEGLAKELKQIDSDTKTKADAWKKPPFTTRRSTKSSGEGNFYV